MFLRESGTHVIKLWKAHRQISSRRKTPAVHLAHATHRHPHSNASRSCCTHPAVGVRYRAAAGAELGNQFSFAPVFQKPIGTRRCLTGLMLKTVAIGNARPMFAAVTGLCKAVALYGSLRALRFSGAGL